MKFKPYTWKTSMKHTAGYRIIRNLSHPFSQSQGRIFEHRAVMENHLKRYLKKGETVHHINGIRHDNRVKNLAVFESNSAHILHEYSTKQRPIITPFKKGLAPFKHRKGCGCFRCDYYAEKRHSFKAGQPPVLHKNPNCKCFRCTKIPINKKS